MANIWSTEAWAFAIAGIALLLIGMITDSWVIAILTTCGFYIGWLYFRLLKLEHWIRKGTRTSQVYDDKGFVGIIIRQLYEQKQSQRRRKQRTKQLLRRLNQNISALPDATVLLNRDFQIEWCNEPAHYLLNLRSPQDLGNKVVNLIRDSELQAYLSDPGSREYIEIESPADPGISIQVKVVAFGGNQSLLIARNISDQKQFQESLKNFVANASHELKSPLTVISGHLEMLEGESDLSKAGRRSLQTAQRQTERMEDLIQGQLLLSQVESHRLEPGEGDRISITELMVNVMAALDKYAERKRLRMQHPEGLFLLGIGIEIESICINLVENAIKYATPGTPIRVCWDASSNGEFIFSVNDLGPGIEKQELPNITRRFYRGAHSRANTSGSGLGLAIVQHAASKHGADFKIKSTPGKGSCFSVSFPSYRCLHQARKSARVVAHADY